MTSSTFRRIVPIVALACFPVSPMQAGAASPVLAPVQEASGVESVPGDMTQLPVNPALKIQDSISAPTAVNLNIRLPENVELPKPMLTREVSPAAFSAVSPVEETALGGVSPESVASESYDQAAPDPTAGGQASSRSVPEGASAPTASAQAGAMARIGEKMPMDASPEDALQIGNRQFAEDRSERTADSNEETRSYSPIVRFNISGRWGTQHTSFQVLPAPKTESFQTNEEKELIRRTQAGDPEAFEALYRRHLGFVRATIRKIIGSTPVNGVDVEDLVQETFLKMREHIGDFRFESAFSTWLYRIAANEALMRKRNLDYGKYDSMDEPDEREDDASPKRQFGRPDLRLEGTVDRVSLEKALIILTPKRRLAFRLFYEEGYKIEEIADMLGVSVSTIKGRIFDSRIQLRKELSFSRKGAPDAQ